MALQSVLSKGDPKLEAAATSHAAHVTPGAFGLHVAKIPTALIQLDQASIAVDSSYGPKTAAAVLAYKTKRNLVNPAYQTKPDNICGIVTITKIE